MTTDTAVLPAMAFPDTPDSRRRTGLLRQLGIDTGYTLTGFPVAIAAFVVVVTGLSVGAGLLVVWVGIAVLAGTATLGVAAQGLVLWWPLRADGYRYRPRWGVRGVGLGAARRVAMAWNARV